MSHENWIISLLTTPRKSKFRHLTTLTTIIEVMDPNEFPTPQEWTQFVKQLHEIWNELGFDPSVRQSHFNDIIDQISQTFQARVKQERNVRDQTRRNIQSTASRLSNIYKQLHYPDNDAQDFISNATSPQLSLIQSHDLMTRQLQKVLTVRITVIFLVSFSGTLKASIFD